MPMLNTAAQIAAKPDVLHLTKEKSEDIVCPTCGSVQHKTDIHSGGIGKSICARFFTFTFVWMRRLLRRAVRAESIK